MRNNLKILFVIDSLGTGGAERYLAEQLCELRRAQIETVVVGLRTRSEGVQSQLELLGFDVRILPPMGLLGRMAAIRSVVRAERPDLVHTALFHADIAGRLASVGMPSAVISRIVNTDYAAIRLRDPATSAWRLRLAQVIDGWTARHLTHHVEVNSAAVKAAVVQDLGVAPEKITIIPERRALDRLGAPSIERRRRARLALGLDDDHEVLVNIGRCDFQKGQQYLLEAIATLAPSHPRMVLLIAGRAGDKSSSLEERRDQLGLQDRVRFLGHREDVPEVLAAADLFVFPSFYEGLPGAVLEAMALALPVVATDIAPVREAVEDLRSAVLVPTASTSKLADAIERLLIDRETAQAYGQRGREIFLERFTLSDGTADSLAFYQRVVRSASGSN